MLLAPRTRPASHPCQAKSSAGFLTHTASNQLYVKSRSYFVDTVLLPHVEDVEYE